MPSPQSGGNNEWGAAFRDAERLKLMFTEPHVLARDHLEVALLILTECCPRSERTADLVAAAIRAIDVKLAAEPDDGRHVEGGRPPMARSGRVDFGA